MILRGRAAKTTVTPPAPLLEADYPKAEAWDAVDQIAYELWEAGQHPTAQGHWQLLLIEQEAELGASHPQTLATLNRLSLAVRDQGRCTEARGLQERALAGLVATLGGTHPATLTCLDNLAITCYEQGHPLEALNHAKAAWEGRKQLLGPKHSETIHSLQNLAVITALNGNFKTALKRLREAAVLFDEVHGPEDPKSLKIWGNLAMMLLDLGEIRDAINVQTDLAERAKRAFGTEDARTLAYLAQVIYLEAETGRTGVAYERYQTELRGKTDRFDPTIPFAMTSLFWIARLLMHHGKTDDAVALMRQVAEGREATLGPAHRDTLLAHAWIVVMYWDGKRLEQARMAKAEFEARVAQYDGAFPLEDFIGEVPDL